MTDAKSATDTITQLGDLVGLSGADIAKATDGFDVAFAWNIALDETDLDDWRLLSDQFVQLGGAHQLATGVWIDDDDGTTVRTDIQAFRDPERLVAALTQKLAGAETGGFSRSAPEGWDGLRFVMDRSGGVVCVLANILIDLIGPDCDDKELLSLSDHLIKSLLAPSAAEGGDAPEMTQRAEVGDAVPMERVAPALELDDGEAPSIDAIMASPTPDAPDSPVTREDRPERLVVRTRKGKLRSVDGRLVRIAEKGGKGDVTVAIKKHGRKRKAIARLAIEVEERNQKGKRT